jgi:hypothetical protein
MSRHHFGIASRKGLQPKNKRSRDLSHHIFEGEHLSSQPLGILRNSAMANSTRSHVAPEYLAGMTAFCAGQPKSANPYPSTNIKNYGWERGYRTAAFLEAMG